MSRNFYITTTIPYVNAPPHIGHACELVQADAIARFARQRGDRVRFQTGTDENAFKNVLSARERGIPVEQLVEQNSQQFRALCERLNISYDGFVRTSAPTHFDAVRSFLARLEPDDIYTQEYRGLYCTGCEDFFQERDLVDGACPDHSAPIIEIAETNYFFRLSRYQERLHELISTRRIRIVPETREAEVLRFIERGLTDISLSRNAERSAGWGVPFPGDDEQVVYVWIDALVNYLSGLGYPDGDGYDDFWNSGEVRTHVIGKNVWKFHAIYWPALLLSAELEVPDRILVHGFLTNDGQKISKSSGTAVDPARYIRKFGVEAVRYFLLRHIHPFDDTDFSTTRLAEVYEADLANGLGNLCSRLTTLAETVGLSLGDCSTFTDEISTGGRRSISPTVSFADLFEDVEAFRSDNALETIWTEIRQLNQQLSSEKPWTDIKFGNLDLARDKLLPIAYRLAELARWLAPFLPATAETIQHALAQRPIRKCEPLFPRREQQVEVIAPR